MAGLQGEEERRDDSRTLSAAEGPREEEQDCSLGPASLGDLDDIKQRCREGVGDLSLGSWRKVGLLPPYTSKAVKGEEE